jgi:large subunit ribosomal protein L16
MLMPKRTKYRKQHRLSYDGHAKGNTELHFGEYGLVANEGAWVTAQQIEAARIAMTRYMKRGGKVWINIFPHMPLTKKALGVRQGKGKGNVEGYVAVVKKGKIMFEIGEVSEEIAREALRLASHKLPITCKIIKKEEKGGESNEG